MNLYEKAFRKGRRIIIKKVKAIHVIDPLQT